MDKMTKRTWLLIIIHCCWLILTGNLYKVFINTLILVKCTKNGTDEEDNNNRYLIGCGKLVVRIFKCMII